MSVWIFYWRRNSWKECWFENLQSFDTENETLVRAWSAQTQPAQILCNREMENSGGKRDEIKIMVKDHWLSSNILGE